MWIFFWLRITWSWFFFKRVVLRLGILLNTYIAIIRPIKDFLETFKVKKFMKKWHLDPIFGILADPKILKKLCVFSLLLYFILYLPIYVSYDRDSFSSVLCYAWAHFWIFILVSSDLSKSSWKNSSKRYGEKTHHFQNFGVHPRIQKCGP